MATTLRHKSYTKPDGPLRTSHLNCPHAQPLSHWVLVLNSTKDVSATSSVSVSLCMVHRVTAAQHSVPASCVPLALMPTSLKRKLSEEDIPNLEQKLADISFALSASKRTSKKLQRQARVTQQPSAFLWNVALVLFELSGWSTQAPLLFLEQKRRGKNWDMAHVPRDLENWFLDAPLADITELTDATTPTQARALQTAKQWLSEHALHQWVHEQNNTKGVAPMSSLVLRQLHHGVGHEAGAHSLQAGCMLNAQRTNLQWLRRWRRRWNVKLGRFAVRQCVPMDVMQAKVFT